MYSGERPIGAAKGKQTNTMASCQPPPPPAASAQPMLSHCLPDSTSFNGICNRQYLPQPLWQPPPTACPTLSGAASVPSLLMHWGGGVVTNYILQYPQESLLNGSLRTSDGWVAHTLGLDPWLEACAQTRVKHAQVCAVLGGKCA